MKKINLITKVERTPVLNLKGMIRVSKTEVRLPQGIQWEELTVKPHAQLSVSDKQEDKATIWTARLAFKACEPFPDRGHYAYRCRLFDGRCRLIGTDERPFPVVSVGESMPEKVTENQLPEVTITWQSPRFIPYIRE